MIPFKFAYMQRTKAKKSLYGDFFSIGVGGSPTPLAMSLRSAAHWLPKSFHTSHFLLFLLKWSLLTLLYWSFFLQKRFKICHNSQDVLLEIRVRSKRNAYWPQRPCGVFS